MVALGTCLSAVPEIEKKSCTRWLKDGIQATYINKTNRISLLQFIKNINYAASYPLLYRWDVRNTLSSKKVKR